MNTCATCSTPFAARRRTRRYCSNACRQRRYRNKSANAATVTVDASAIDPTAVETPSAWDAWTDDWGNGDDEW